MHDQQQPALERSGTDVAALTFLAVAAIVSGVQAAFLLHDAAGERDVEAGRITTWHHVPHLESLLALIDLAVLGVAVLVLLTIFAEGRRHPWWAASTWLFIVLATVEEWRLLGLRLSESDIAVGSPLGLAPRYEFRAHESMFATAMCLAAVAVTAFALRSHQGPQPSKGT